MNRSNIIIKDLHIFSIIEEMMFWDQINLYLVPVIFSNKMCFQKLFHDFIVDQIIFTVHFWNIFFTQTCNIIWGRIILYIVRCLPVQLFDMSMLTILYTSILSISSVTFVGLRSTCINVHVR